MQIEQATGWAAAPGLDCVPVLGCWLLAERPAQPLDRAGLLGPLVWYGYFNLKKNIDIFWPYSNSIQSGRAFIHLYSILSI